MKDCVFCKIIDGELPSFKIYEDDFCLAILDISNDAFGHTLVFPKKHNESVATCDSTTLGRIMDTCKKVGNHYIKNCGFEGFNIFNCNGKVAEQSVFHVHFHIIPRKQNDNIKVCPSLQGSGANLEQVWETLKIDKQNILDKTENVFDDSVVLYTDGACSGNPGRGGWAAILSFNGKEKILSGGEVETTNNRMELMAVIQGLENVKSGNKVKVFSDSAYVVNAFNQGWISNWKRNNWKTSSGAEVSNKQLWFRLIEAMQNLEVEFIKVKGHSDNVNNNRCDALAREEISKL